MASLTPRLDKLQRNYIINGDMRYAQRGTSFVAIANTAYSLDRWQYSKVGAMVHTVTQDTDVPTLAQAGYLFPNSLRANLTTPDTAIAAGDYCILTQVIEGYNWQQLAQRTFTISFWVKATLPGTYAAYLLNSGSDRSFVGEYTINTTNTWEYKTIVVPASPVAGTWNYTNGWGVRLGFVLAVGSTYQSTAGSWLTGNFAGTANTINGTNTGATDFRVTGVMVNEGALADPAFSLFARDPASELLACYRYYARGFQGALGTSPLTTTVRFIFPYKVPMRTNPTVAQVPASSGAGAVDQCGVAGSVNIQFATPQATSVNTGDITLTLGVAAIQFRPYVLNTDIIQAEAEL